MCFASTGWPITVSEPAAALSDGERDPLSFRIQSALLAEVERPPRFVEIELKRAAFAGNAVHGLECDRNVPSFDASMAIHSIQGGFRDQDPHRRLSRTDDAAAFSGLRADGYPKQLGEGVVHVLISGAPVRGDGLCPGPVGVIDEAHPSAARGRERVVGAVPGRGGLDVRGDDVSRGLSAAVCGARSALRTPPALARSSGVAAPADSDGGPSPMRISRAASTERLPTATAAPTSRNHRSALAEAPVVAEARETVPASTRAEAPRAVEPVSRRISASGARNPSRCASPEKPISRRDRRPISLTTTVALARSSARGQKVRVGRASIRGRKARPPIARTRPED